MDIWNLGDDIDYNKAVQLCKNLLEKHALIPILGAGFSLGTQTETSGSIPSVNDLKAELFKYIEKFSGYSPKELDEISQENLSDLSNTFWNILERIPDENMRGFYDYITLNFQDIEKRKPFQDAFLNVRWPYLFTLNYDSLIEDSSRAYQSIIPYDPINRHLSSSKTRLYKLHGDASRFVATGDKKYLILSKDQYIKSLMDEANEDMRDELLTVFSSKSVLFFGCGLSDELDLLYSSQFALRDKAKSIDTNEQSIIYINYESTESTHSEFPLSKKDKLSQYGITHIFRVNSDKQSQKFFEDLSEISTHLQHTSSDSFLNRFSALQFNFLQIDDIAGRNYLFHERLVWKELRKHRIALPGYFIERSELTEAIDYVSQGNPVCFLSGNFYSGKTFFLLGIAKHFSTKKVYLFPSGTHLTNKQLDTLLQKDNSLFCFDSNSLSISQIKSISNATLLDTMQQRHSNLVVVIEKSDAPMFKYIFEARNVYRNFRIFSLRGYLNSSESVDFNRKIGPISLPPYREKETILDYIVSHEHRLLGSSNSDNYFLEPQKNILSCNVQQRLKALIMLATEIRITAKRAIQFGIDNSINDIISCCGRSGSSSVIEKDYSNYGGGSSGFEFVCNSKYWVIRSLSTYAKREKSSIENIANAYLSIIQSYRSIHRDNDVVFYQQCEPYYFFDHIQVLFNHQWFPNSSKLMNAIYEKLLITLSGSYQFLHQKAKEKLRIAQVQLKSGRYKDASVSLTEAVYNITRAKELAREFPDARNIDETLLHMTYTEGRVYIECSCIDDRYLAEAVSSCYELYQMQSATKHDVYDFSKPGGNDGWAFNKFKAKLMTRKSLDKCAGLDREKAGALLYRWTSKKFNIKNPSSV